MKRQFMVMGSSLGLLLFVFACMVPVAFGQSTDSAEVSGLLSEAKTEAVQMNRGAEELRTFTRSNLHWESHAAKIEEIKQNVNRSGELLAKLQNARSEASPWQQQTIDRIDPLLREIAATVESTIDHLNKHPQQLKTEPYREYVDANADLTTDLSTMISDYIAYGKAKNKSQQLAQKLEIPEN
ncbi:MAG TPA: hypothetical protein VNF02_06805 [Candidatus Limnocylindrales bacterium]|nr:hypothetical protein [Candidatus Limnocylindrales bacterium]